MRLDLGGFGVGFGLQVELSWDLSWVFVGFLEIFRDLYLSDRKFGNSNVSRYLDRFRRDRGN